MVKAKVYVTLKKSVLDPQGSAVQGGLATLGYTEVKEVRVGKYLELLLDVPAAAAAERVRAMCEQLLSNPVIEQYSFELEEAGK